MEILGFLILALVYFLPAIIAMKDKNALGIFLLTLLLGWTIIGWIGAMIWAILFKRVRPE